MAEKTYKSSGEQSEETWERWTPSWPPKKGGSVPDGGKEWWSAGPNASAAEPSAQGEAATHAGEGASAAGPDAGAAEPGVRVLLRTQDQQGLQRSGTSKEALHTTARAFLNQKITEFSEHPGRHAQHQTVDENEWTTWREYIALHSAAAEILGTTGVTAIRIEEIEGTVDPNRQGSRRVDIVVYNADGMYTRLHPGNARQSDAQVICRRTVVGADVSCGSQGEPVGLAAHAYRQPPFVYTKTSATNIPQGDRMGRRRMFDKLQTLPAVRPLELTHADVESFPWWLWLPSIGSEVNAVIGDGIERIALVHSEAEPADSVSYLARVRFLIVHTDKTALLLHADKNKKSRSAYWVELLESDSRQYVYWVNWSS